MILKAWEIQQHQRRLAEVGVIAIGMMAALAVDNRNDERKDRMAEQQYLEGIAADLQSTADGLVEIGRREGRQQQAGAVQCEVHRSMIACVYPDSNGSWRFRASKIHADARPGR